MASPNGTSDGNVATFKRRTSSPPPPPQKTKRKLYSSCDQCRLRRVKCDAFPTSDFDSFLYPSLQQQQLLASSPIPNQNGQGPSGSVETGSETVLAGAVISNPSPVVQCSSCKRFGLTCTFNDAIQGRQKKSKRVEKARSVQALKSNLNGMGPLIRSNDLPAHTEAWLTRVTLLEGLEKELLEIAYAVLDPRFEPFINTVLPADAFKPGNRCRNFTLWMYDQDNPTLGDPIVRQACLAILAAWAIYWSPWMSQDLARDFYLRAKELAEGIVNRPCVGGVEGLLLFQCIPIPDGCEAVDPALILELGLRHCFRLKLHVGSGNLDVTSVQGKVKQLGHLMYWFAICHDMWEAVINRTPPILSDSTTGYFWNKIAERDAEFRNLFPTLRSRRLTDDDVDLLLSYALPSTLNQWRLVSPVQLAVETMHLVGLEAKVDSVLKHSEAFKSTYGALLSDTRNYWSELSTVSQMKILGTILRFLYGIIHLSDDLDELDARRKTQEELAYSQPFLGIGAAYSLGSFMNTLQNSPPTVPLIYLLNNPSSILIYEQGYAWPVLERAVIILTRAADVFDRVAPLQSIPLMDETVITVTCNDFVEAAERCLWGVRECAKVWVSARKAVTELEPIVARTKASLMRNRDADGEVPQVKTEPSSSVTGSNNAYPSPRFDASQVENQLAGPLGFSPETTEFTFGSDFANGPLFSQMQFSQLGGFQGFGAGQTSIPSSFSRMSNGSMTSSQNGSTYSSLPTLAYLAANLDPQTQTQHNLPSDLEQTRTREAKSRQQRTRRSIGTASSSSSYYCSSQTSPHSRSHTLPADVPSLPYPRSQSSISSITSDYDRPQIQGHSQSLPDISSTYDAGFSQSLQSLAGDGSLLGQRQIASADNINSFGSLGAIATASSQQQVLSESPQQQQFSLFQSDLNTFSQLAQGQQQYPLQVEQQDLSPTATSVQYPRDDQQSFFQFLQGQPQGGAWTNQT